MNNILILLVRVDIAKIHGNSFGRNEMKTQKTTVILIIAYFGAVVETEAGQGKGHRRNTMVNDQKNPVGNRMNSCKPYRHDTRAKSRRFVKFL